MASGVGSTERIDGIAVLGAAVLVMAACLGDARAQSSGPAAPRGPLPERQGTVGTGLPSPGTPQVITTPAAVPSASIPRSVSRGAHDSALLTWTNLPPIRIDAATLSLGDGSRFRWEVVDRVNSFSVVRSTEANGDVEYVAYVGVQRLNAAWVRGGLPGNQDVFRVSGYEQTTVAPGVVPLSGVDPLELAYGLTIETRGTDGERRTVQRRRVLGADTASVNVNGQPVRLAAFVVQVETDRPGWGARSVGRALYVPVLGLAVSGEFIEPEPSNWRLDAVQVGPDVLRDVRAAALR